MAEDSSISLVNLGKLSKPADTLIKKVSSAVGGLFEPYQIKRVAKAKAEASLIEAKSKIEVTDLHHRAMHRFVEEESKKQANMESITEKALPLLGESADPSKVEDDWLSNFFDKSRIVSDNDMQNLWSRVLAGESNKAGSYSKRTVNFLSGLDKSDAELFAKVCGFGWVLADVVPLIFDEGDSIYENNGITYATLIHLENIGLIRFNSITGHSIKGFPDRFVVQYYGRPLELHMEDENQKTLSIGRVLLTKIGAELAPISGAKPIDGFFEYVSSKWEKQLVKTVSESGD